MPMVRIRYGELHIGRVMDSSAISHGDNRQSRWKHVHKQNEAFGTVFGANHDLSGLKGIVNDRNVREFVNRRQRS